MPHIKNSLRRMVLRTAKLAGAYSLASHSRWRQQRLLILAYHGISQSDEHLWNPNLYISGECLRQRMETLKRSGCHVLPLSDALRRLYEGSLPELSVVLTFDDGAYDFYSRAYPIIESYGFPVTVYLTTYYSRFNKPVFNVMCSYLLWRARDSRLQLKTLTGEAFIIDLAAEHARAEVVRKLTEYSCRQNLSAGEKDCLARQMAAQLGIDYEQISRERILHIMSPGEVRELAARGVDFQLHTHRHRTPSDRDLFIKEVKDNRESIHEMTGQSPSHFCYPDGEFKPQFVGWLKDVGIDSATTCYPRLATPKTNVFALPRLIDTSSISADTFEGWVCGVSSLLARREKRIQTGVSGPLEKPLGAEKLSI
jgi:peptidoglycan/xylan/chitin deacetylase (PgdA/CDA1 family)